MICIALMTPCRTMCDAQRPACKRNREKSELKTYLFDQVEQPNLSPMFNSGRLFFAASLPVHTTASWSLAKLERSGETEENYEHTHANP